jgi:hypothetical protein
VRTTDRQDWSAPAAESCACAQRSRLIGVPVTLPTKEPVHLGAASNSFRGVASEVVTGTTERRGSSTVADAALAGSAGRGLTEDGTLAFRIYCDQYWLALSGITHRRPPRVYPPSPE